MVVSSIALIDSVYGDVRVAVPRYQEALLRDVPAGVVSAVRTEPFERPARVVASFTALFAEFQQHHVVLVHVC